MRTVLDVCADGVLFVIDEILGEGIAGNSLSVTRSYWVHDGEEGVNVHHELFSFLFLSIVSIIGSYRDRGHGGAYHVGGDKGSQVQCGSSVECEVILDHAICPVTDQCADIEYKEQLTLGEASPCPVNAGQYCYFGSHGEGGTYRHLMLGQVFSSPSTSVDGGGVVVGGIFWGEIDAALLFWNLFQVGLLVLDLGDGGHAVDVHHGCFVDGGSTMDKVGGIGEEEKSKSEIVRARVTTSFIKGLRPAPQSQ